MTTKNITAKTVMLAVLIVSATMMSGCIDSDDIIPQEIGVDIIEKSVISISEINTDPKPILTSNVNNTDPEPILTSDVNTTVIPERPRHIQITAQQRSNSLIINVNGGADYHNLTELRVLVNNETMALYSPDLQVPYTVGCTIIGDWKVIIEGTFKDRKTQVLMTTRFSGISNPKTETTIAPERYVEPSGTSREEAKRICEENGVVWGCDDPTPVPTPIATPMITPTPEPTPMVTPTPRPNKPVEVWRTESHIHSRWKVTICIKECLDDNEIIFGTASMRYGGWRPEDSLDQLKLIKIYVDDQLVATIIPDVIDNPYGGHRVMNNTCIIKLPNGLTNSDRIIIKGTFVNLISPEGCGDLLDGEYQMYSNIHKSDDPRIDYPIYQG